jgi:RNA recognition motif-containing protein
MSSTRRRRGAETDGAATMYDDIMGRGATGSEKGTSANGTSSDAANSLSSRLVSFRKWLHEDAKATVHPAICVVNGEATDGTRNAPVLLFGPPVGSAAATAASNGNTSVNTATGRLGNIDGPADQALYDRTMGCQIRAVREIKQDEVLMTIPRGSMITPDLVASSDAGKAILACIRAPAESDNENDKIGFWDSFENTTICQGRLSAKVPRNNGPQMLVKILQERKRVEGIFRKHSEDLSSDYTLAEPQYISTRAPLLAFLIHQRFTNSGRPQVAGHDFFEQRTLANDRNALQIATTILSPPGSPETFGAYARTLPSSSSLPLCWKRSELALLTGCFPGHGILQEVAASTLQLATEFIALLNAGVLKRFPEVFAPGVLTWERWVWAAAMTASRILPSSCYMDAVGDGENATTEPPADPLEFQSPLDVFDELGVMIPLLDMLNHEIEANQVTWKPNVPARTDGDDMADDTLQAHPPRAIAHKKVRKGSEIFTCYGMYGNSRLIEQYGFALINNPSEEVRIGWALADGVGSLDPPQDQVPSVDDGRDFFCASNDEKLISAWWSKDRIELLKKDVLSAVNEKVLEVLISGKKLELSAFNDGSYDPVIISAAAIATMPVDSVSKNLTLEKGSKLVISTHHLLVLQRYLELFFSRKLEKLLKILDNGLKGHFDGLNLWTKASEGGLEYEQDPGAVDTAAVQYTGWQSFFDSRAYRTAMEVEKSYYAMGSDSCVLTLYDCQLRTLQASMKVGNLSDSLLDQLSDLGFDVPDDEGEHDDRETNSDGDRQMKIDSHMSSDFATEMSKESGEAEVQSNGLESNGGRTPRNRKRNRRSKNRGNSRRPAIKLHVGNLSYKTTPSDLYDYFSSVYGEANILECHIPTERDNGRSRGFGFVAMPEEVANRALQSGRKHEVGGRAVKIAKSNSVGTGSSGGKADVPLSVASDRCAVCGYSPRYCTCNAPRIPSVEHAAGQYGPSFEQGEAGRSSRSYERRGSLDRNDRYGRYEDIDRDRRVHRYGEPPSGYPEYERDDDRRSRRERDRSRDRSRSGGRHYDYDDDRGSRRLDRSDESWERERKRSRSRSRERNRKKKSKRRTRSRSRSPSA